MRILIPIVVLLGCGLLAGGCAKPGDDKSSPPAPASSPAEQSPDAEAEASVPPVAGDAQASIPQDDVPVPAAASLAIGDLAPPIRVGGWALNEPENGETAFANDKVRVVEFWATWCGPCKASMPHLNELSEKYRDAVVFVGVTDEDEATVEAFLDQPSQTPEQLPWRELLSYGLAFDDAGYLGKELFSATGQSGIPAAFIIGADGYLLWYGHPMTMDDPLTQIVAGTWNKDTALQKMEAIQKAEEEMSRLITELMSAQRDADWERALSVLDELMADESRAALLGPKAIGLRYELLSRGGKLEQARAVADEMRADRWDDAPFLGGMAWSIATAYPEDVRDLDFALQAAQRAVELTQEEDGAILDSLARVYYESGDLDTAIEWQRKAVAVPQDPRLQQALQEALDRYLIERAKAVEAEAAPEVEEDAVDPQS